MIVSNYLSLYNRAICKTFASSENAQVGGQELALTAMSIFFQIIPLPHVMSYLAKIIIERKKDVLGICNFGGRFLDLFRAVG